MSSPAGHDGHAPKPARTIDPASIRSVIATDCGSTTTKAILIERNAAGEYRLTCRGEAPTTVEAPVEDVTRGVLNAVREIQELRGRPFLEDDHIISPQTGEPGHERGTDIYISTSSAGGGLQMMVTGVVKKMTAESAARAALGAGAIVMDSIATNDRRLPHEKIERIRQLRPDMLLMAGGTDGGTEKHVIAVAEMLRAAQPRPRLGQAFNLPVIYAGNPAVRPQIEKMLGGQVALQFVDNVRPSLDVENLGPARDAIHEVFMEHVMQQAPGYSKLMSWADVPIMPTPGAMGLIIQALAERDKVTVVGVDIGGATTDVFSVFDGIFNRTVSANLGMSYSVSNVLAEAGIANIQRWVPFDLEEHELRDRIGNKMIRPTTIPQTLDELKIEQAISREALRLSFVQHRQFAVKLRGGQQERSISDAFDQSAGGNSLVDMMKLDLLVGSGGVLSHAPRRSQSMMMMIDAFAVEGVTELAVDSIFMMPHLGVLSTIHPAAATEVFEKDCLVRLGTCIAPVGGKSGHVLDVELMLPTGKKTVRLSHGDLQLIPLGEGETAAAVLTPARGVDVGAGPGVRVERTVRGGQVGLVLDARGRRPLLVPTERAARVAAALRWSRALDMYPEG
ncbi:MAG: glutamate mutase L [Kofleriaceae bacterium]|nr:glutamate mutase L [Kofleriaceae bacterium]MBP9207133.1 glutamate mutase L [Kofleriaceae bacterium]